MLTNREIKIYFKKYQNDKSNLVFQARIYNK